LRAVEANLGNVAPPAARAAGVTEFHVAEFHGLGEAAGDVVGAGSTRAAEIAVDQLAVANLPPQVQHAVHALAHVEVWFGLFAIAEDLQLSGIGLELPYEIQDHAMGAVRSTDIGKAVDPGLEAVVVTERAHQPFAGKLARPIERNGEQWPIVLRRR